MAITRGFVPLSCHFASEHHQSLFTQPQDVACQETVSMSRFNKWSKLFFFFFSGEDSLRRSMDDYWREFPALSALCVSLLEEGHD